MYLSIISSPYIQMKNVSFCFLPDNYAVDRNFKYFILSINFTPKLVFTLISLLQIWDSSINWLHVIKILRQSKKECFYNQKVLRSIMTIIKGERTLIVFKTHPRVYRYCNRKFYYIYFYIICFKGVLVQ